MRWWVITLPFFSQGIALAIDEFHFHLKRPLPTWERIGHPVDTLMVLLCFCFVFIFPYSSFTLKFYILLSFLSCLCVTKDEWVHKTHAPSGEQWIHSILFIIHPLVMISIGLQWPILHEQGSQFIHPDDILVLKLAMISFLTIMVAFWIYQIVYWNVLKRAGDHST